MRRTKPYGFIQIYTYDQTVGQLLTDLSGWYSDFVEI